MALFLALIVGVGYSLSIIYNDETILYIAFAFSIFMNITSYWFSDTIALATAGAQPIDPVHNEVHLQLKRIVENLAITAGLPTPRIYVINDPSPNAFATGRNKEHAAVAVTSGLLGMLNRSELEGVIAHELSHIGNKDILLSSVVVVLVGFISLIAHFFTRGSLLRGGGDSDRRGGNPLAIIGVIFIILSPIVATLIQLAISRKREFLADTSGALLTRYPEGLAAALEKIQASGIPLARASSATAHLYISNPLGARATQGLASLFSTHPPTAERVSILRNLEVK